MQNRNQNSLTLSAQDVHNNMILAAEAGSDEIVKLLLRSGANVHARMRGAHGAEVDDDYLIFAIHGNNPDVVETLIQAGIDVNNGGENGFTPLMHAVEAINTRNAETVEIVTLLLAAGADSEAIYNGETVYDHLTRGHRDYHTMAQRERREDVRLRIFTNLYQRYQNRTSALELFKGRHTDGRRRLPSDVYEFEINSFL